MKDNSQLKKGLPSITSQKKNGVGFTLIELLVVMVIIGVLIGISAFGLQGARESARDARRKADLEQIRSALELYKSDCNAYPSGSGNVTTVLGTTFTGSVGSCNSNTYLEKVPNDTTSGSNYYYSSAGVTYEVCAALEGGGSDTCGGSCGATCNYRAINP